MTKGSRVLEKKVNETQVSKPVWSHLKGMCFHNAQNIKIDISCWWIRDRSKLSFTDMKTGLIIAVNHCTGIAD